MDDEAPPVTWFQSFSDTVWSYSCSPREPPSDQQELHLSIHLMTGSPSADPEVECFLSASPTTKVLEAVPPDMISYLEDR